MTVAAAYPAPRGVLHCLFRVKKWVSVASLIADDNAASIALAKRLGAEPEGPVTHKMLGTVRIWRHHRATHDAWLLKEGANFA